jgi:thiol:disulfide interchange protein DsbD
MENFLGQLNTTLQTSILLSMLIAYTGGILSSLTPCVYPMIPITATVVGHSNIGGSRLRGLLLSLCYVIGMALTYALLGIFAAATGRFFGTINSHPLTFIVVGNIILLFGLSMLDVISFPQFTHTITARAKGFFGVFIAGILSALVAGPCTAPVLGVLLTYVATSQDIVLGGVMLFVFSLGMGTILIAVGTFSSILTSIPKSGKWMVNIKKALGYLMLLLAQYFFIKAGSYMI